MTLGFSVLQFITKDHILENCLSSCKQCQILMNSKAIKREQIFLCDKFIGIQIERKRKHALVL